MIVEMTVVGKRQEYGGLISVSVENSKYQALRAGAVAKCTATWEGAGAAFNRRLTRRWAVKARIVASHKVGNRRLFGVGFVGIPGRGVDHEFQRLKQPRQLSSSGGRYCLAANRISPAHRQ